MKTLRWLPIVLAGGSTLFATGCAGGGSHQYTEVDNHQSVSADLETIFYVQLPDTMKGKASFSPNVLSLGKDLVDEATHRRTLEFAARGLGETEIRVGAEFSLRVKVTSASDRPGMHISH